MCQISRASLNRTWQRRIFILLIFLGIWTGILGIYTLHISPTLSFGSGSPHLHIGPNIQKIGQIQLTPSFFKSLPIFFSKEEESHWWQMQEKLSFFLKRKDTVQVIFAEGSGTTEKVTAKVESMPLFDVIKNTGIIYLVGLIFMISSASVFQKHPSTPGSVLAFYLILSALYFINIAPVVGRSIVLHPFPFHIFTKFLYISASSMIFLIHFVFLFPRRKKMLEKIPALLHIFHGFFLLTAIFYLLGIITFGAIVPFFAVVQLIIIVALLHSLFREKDLFLKKQVRHSFFAPLITGTVFIIMNLPPVIWETLSVRFTYFAIFCLILPFALSSALDNFHLYQERLELEQASHKEKEQLRQELHDSILNSFACISLSAGVSLDILSKSLADVENHLKLILKLAQDSSQQLRNFLWVIDDHYNSWQDFLGYLRKCGNDLVKYRNIDFDLNVCEAVASLDPPPPMVRVCFYRVFQEAMINALRHSNADEIKTSISKNENMIVLEIKDNGKGFEQEQVEEGHYGLENMRRRVDELRGSFALETRISRGTYIKVQLPLG